VLPLAWSALNLGKPLVSKLHNLEMDLSLHTVKRLH
jgi:hypothetical protein